MRILHLIVLVACIASEAVARAQDEGDARPSSRGLLKRGLLAKGKQTTTTTPPPQEEAEYEDEAEYADGEAQEPSTEAPPSSTEGKKLVAGGVRPFRSNTDLLEALKRRRAQAAEAKHGHSPAAAAPAQAQDSPVDPPTAAKSSYSKKRFNNAPKESNNEEAPATAKPSRGRFGRPSQRSIQEDHEEQNESAPAPARASRAFARRAN